MSHLGRRRTHVPATYTLGTGHPDGRSATRHGRRHNTRPADGPRRHRRQGFQHVTKTSSALHMTVPKGTCTRVSPPTQDEVPHRGTATPRVRYRWSFLHMPAWDPPDLKTLFDKHPQRLLKKCPAPSGWSAGKAVGAADVKMFSALPTALHADQTHDAGHSFRRHRGCLSNRVSRSGGSKKECALFRAVPQSAVRWSCLGGKNF